MSNAPSRNQYDDANAWRQYAAELRAAVGNKNQEIAPYKERALQAEQELAKARKECKQLEERVEIGLKRGRKNRHMLNTLERDLDAGDYPAAIERLARRRQTLDRIREMEAKP